jgi:acetyl-CoA carboxylase biotin carboxyl carrier protein
VTASRDSRRYRPSAVAVAEAAGDGKVQLRSPLVGLWRGAPPRGALVGPGAALGEVDVLGEHHLLVAPAGVAGVVVSTPAGGRAELPVAHGDELLVLDPHAAGEVAAAEAAAATHTPEGGLVFRSPSGGRFYSRPSPAEAPFVEPGTELSAGQTLCILEVMKSFHRVAYGGAGLPERARVRAVLPADGDDVEAGAPLLELESLDP